MVFWMIPACLVRILNSNIKAFFQSLGIFYSNIAYTSIISIVVFFFTFQITSGLFASPVIWVGLSFLAYELSSLAIFCYLV